jgi:hypothetical protein
VSIVRIHRRGRKQLARKPALIVSHTDFEGNIHYECSTCGWSSTVYYKSAAYCALRAAPGVFGERPTYPLDVDAHGDRCKGVRAAA